MTAMLGPITADEILDKAQELLPHEKEYLSDAIDALDGADPRPLSDLQHRLADEYANLADLSRVAKSTGLPIGKVVKELHKPHVREATVERLLARMEKSELDGVYVRNYILGLLELCPTDWFTVMPDGRWCIDPDQFAKAPVEIKRYVDSIELRSNPRTGEQSLFVKFVSKSQALSLAAKYTMVEKHQHSHTVVPWAEIAGKEVDAGADPLQRALEEAGLADRPA